MGQMTYPIMRYFWSLIIACLGTGACNDDARPTGGGAVSSFKFMVLGDQGRGEGTQRLGVSNKKVVP